MARKVFRFKTLTIFLFCTICLGTVFFIKDNVKLSYVPRTDREGLLLHVKNLINSGNEKLPFNRDSKILKKLPNHYQTSHEGTLMTLEKGQQSAKIEGQACRVPILDINATEIMELLKEPPKLICNSSRDWVEVVGSTAKVCSWAKEKYGDIICSFTDIIRANDHRQYQGMTTKTYTEYNLEMSDVIRVHCTSKSGVIWQKVFMGIRLDQDIFDRIGWSLVPKDSLKLNVLMFGFDSLSHNMWKRKLPKTYKYATNDLKGIALNGYNIVGDGTPQALIPILTGKTELELPDTRKRMGTKAYFVNVYPFIWNNFQENGYVTAWSEDMSQIGTFTYRLKGFNEQPVDHYMRTYFMEAAPHYESDKKFCYGELSRFQIMLGFVKNLYEVYKDQPKFIFAFHSEYSHESNDWIANADEDTLKWLQDFYKKGYFNNTLLILMSDHGSRFAEIRNTLQGKQEERLPGFIFVFPNWFSKKYPKAYENFKKNADRLSTPFDIHETLKNVLHFEGAGTGSIENRGISLFKEIPLSRSCQDAAIEPHWCTCLKWEPVSIRNAIVTEAVTHLLRFVNSYTSKHRKLCAKLYLGEILWSAKLIPNEQILKFKKNSDYDGFVGDMSDRTKISVEIYQLKVSFNPGDMIFEASVRYQTMKKKFVVSEREISRVNKYRHMTHCIEDADILHHLRKFCYCI